MGLRGLLLRFRGLLVGLSNLLRLVLGVGVRVGYYYPLLQVLPEHRYILGRLNPNRQPIMPPRDTVTPSASHLPYTPS